MQRTIIFNNLQIITSIQAMQLFSGLCFPKIGDNIETLDEKDGLFNPIKVDDVREFDAVSKEAMEQRAIENGILDKAYENAKEIIEKLVNNDVVQEQGYTIIFEVIG